MTKTRLEAFSDGVLAIIITIMVLELKVPHGGSFNILLPLLPVFLSYILSFVFIGIYWNNHHHLMAAAKAINAKIMWLNLHLLFWLSLVPFTSGWLGENKFAAHPTVLYGFVLLASGIAFKLLQDAILETTGHNSKLKQEVGADLKGKLSLGLYLSAIGIAFYYPILSNLIYVVVAVMWFIPDKRFEKVIKD